jgi:hypothetical protein
LEGFVIEHDIRGSGGAGCVRSAGQGTDIAVGADELAIRPMLEKSSIIIERDDVVRIGEMVSCENIRLTSFTHKPKEDPTRIGRHNYCLVGLLDRTMLRKDYLQNNLLRFMI